MQKNHIIQLLFLTLLSGLLSCNSVPSAPTVITGKFIDENEQPIVGYLVVTSSILNWLNYEAYVPNRFNLRVIV